MESSARAGDRASRSGAGEPAQDWATRRPAGRLRPFVDRYVGYRLTGFPPGLHRGFPSRHMTFIVSIGESIDVGPLADPTRRRRSYGAVVGGLQKSSALVAHNGNQEGVAVELTPVGCRTLLGVPARELWRRSMDLTDLVGGAGTELWERLQVAPTWEERFEACDDVLLRLAGEDLVAADLQRCWSALVASSGRVSVEALAGATGYSRRHLSRRFRDEFGLNPKLAARIVRFERARTLLASASSHLSIAQVAASCGYYDQAHLHRDFSEFGGCTPAQLLREDLPFFQDDLVVERT